MRMFLNQIKTTTMSIRKAFKSVFLELDEKEVRIALLEEKMALLLSDEEVDSAIHEEEAESEAISIENYSEFEDKEKVIEFAESVGIEVDKRKGIDTLKKEIEEKIKESE